MTVDDYLRSVGKKCFIDYYELFKDLNIDREVLINTFKKEGFSTASCDTKASDGRQIFIKGLEESALKNIIKSSKMESKIKEKAQLLLDAVGFQKQKKYWIVSSNPDIYDSIEAFKTLSEVDWGNAANNHINVGDIVYIYITKPKQRIALKTKVTKNNFNETELLGNDGQFNKTEGLRTHEKYFRLKLIKFIENDLLTIDKLHENGMTGNIQGKRTIEGETLSYILNNENAKSFNTKNENSIDKYKSNAFFGNGIFAIILNEILEAQEINSNIISYIQPYKTTVFKLLKETYLSEEHPITFYISTTNNLNMIEYTADIVGWEDKRELFTSSKDRIDQLNKHLNQYQKSTGGVYQYIDTDKAKECVNLILIKNLKKLTIPFPSSMLIKVSDGTTYKPRTQPGGWSEVYKLNTVGTPVFIQDLDKEFEKKIIASRYMSRSREERLEKASKVPEEIQVISRGFKRNADVVTAVLDRANGFCEKCKNKAPFIRKKDNTPYLEIHHIKQLADGGEDSVKNAIAVCPNCHRKLHFGI